MGRIFWQFIGILLLVGFVGAYFWWIAAIAAVAALVWMAQRAFREIGAAEVAEACRQAAMAKRADQQHAWVMAGGDPGMYGAYPPPACSGGRAPRVVTRLRCRVGCGCFLTTQSSQLNEVFPGRRADDPEMSGI
jgi:hypothetical protein